jgi:hypothetical protein
MTNEILKTEATAVPDVMGELQSTQKMVAALMQTPHYKKMGPEGLYAIVQKAKVMGISPLDALNGGMFCVNGKVEMSSQMMNRLIRSKGHSVTQVADRCNKTICTLKGRRADNGDEWTVSWSIDDARKAGLVKGNGPWEKFPEAMCFARALSMLARQLFPDVIVDTYVEGEISDAPGLFSPVNISISDEEHLALLDLISSTPDPIGTRAKISQILGTDDFKTIPQGRYEKLMEWIRTKIICREPELKSLDKSEVIEASVEPASLTPAEFFGYHTHASTITIGEPKSDNGPSVFDTAYAEAKGV